MSVPVIEDRQMAYSARTCTLEALPVETINEILSNVDDDSLIQVMRVSKYLRKIVQTNWADILRPIIERDFSPAEAFFRVFDVCSSNLVSAFDLFHDGDVRFGGQLMCRRSPEEGLTRVLKLCRTIKQWEVEFQRLRFVYHPQHSRTLRPHERQRLRQGLYTWWRFSRYFHSSYHFEGTEDLHRFWLRRPESPDVRCNFVRKFSTTQLHELFDMWQTIRAAVSMEICPSIVHVREQLSRAEAARIGWGDPIENDHILATIMKLCPEDILHLLVHRHRYATKTSVIQFVRLSNPFIEDSIEMFTQAIEVVLWEREKMLVAENGDDALEPDMYFPSSSGFPRRYGGIIDHRKAATERLRATYSHDAGKGTHHFVFPRAMYILATIPVGRLVPNS
ncbi:hypothetical protein B0T26DRAFT_654380 [Lasiosphaeria miniovina]|uniref:F-box domain-containing protein n=1 Tax=Lasiosphaeria miniovina TaxID=1954250 RepID=A0AA40A492_9PEZI|nr:uncharacterized protein B0T26DRAFT_654380 [Lasiosphaeria miniovina]KAK0708989.1 hypothetical protein B0T26DRAFT_654380 [Lasiosphaeria miniovina]